MVKTVSNEIQKIRKIKKEDVDINLLIMFDQANSVVTTAVELELKQLNITQPQVRIMNMLSREDRPVTIDELVSWTFKEFNSVSTLINRMEKHGLIKKIKKKEESKTYIILTEKGNIIYHKKVTEQSIHMIFSKLSDEDKRHLFNILKQIRDTTSNILGLDFKPQFLQ